MNEKELMEKAQSLLSEDEVVALEKLICKSSTKLVVKHSLQEHYMKVAYICKTCKSVDEIFYKMKKHPSCNSLISEPVSTLDEECKLDITDIHKISVPVCRQCRSYLASLTKEEVIDKLMNQLSKVC